MALIGGDPDSIDHGGELLRQCARFQEGFRAGFDLVRSQVASACGAASTGGAEAVGRWVAVQGAESEDLGSELNALGVLASSTAADLVAATAAQDVAAFAGRISDGLRGVS